MCYLTNIIRLYSAIITSRVMLSRVLFFVCVATTNERACFNINPVKVQHISDRLKLILLTGG